MTRRSFLIRHVKNRPPPEEAIRRYLLQWTSGDLYHNPGAFPRVCSPDLFGNTLPLELEVGCGTGEVLCWRAGSDPGANFLGVDFNLKSLYMAVDEAASRDLGNIRFIKASMQHLYPLMPAGSVRAIYVHFPDPALRPKYRKRRLINASFMDAVYRTLIPGGLLSIVTDSEGLFMDEVLPVVEAHGLLVRLHEERYLTGYNPPVKSRYQQYWEQLGATIYYIELRKEKGEG